MYFTFTFKEETHASNQLDAEDTLQDTPNIVCHLFSQFNYDETMKGQAFIYPGTLNDVVGRSVND
jgi:hypothetical protein